MAVRDRARSRATSSWSTPSCQLVCSLRIMDDSRRVVFEVGGHDCFGAVDHEEGSESRRSVNRGTDSPDDGGQLFDPAPGGALEWYLESRLQAVEDALVGPFRLAVGFRVGD